MKTKLLGIVTSVALLSVSGIGSAHAATITFDVTGAIAGTIITTGSTLTVDNSAGVIVGGDIGNGFGDFPWLPNGQQQDNTSLPYPRYLPNGQEQVTTSPPAQRLGALISGERYDVFMWGGIGVTPVNPTYEMILSFTPYTTDPFVGFTGGTLTAYGQVWFCDLHIVTDCTTNNAFFQQASFQEITFTSPLPAATPLPAALPFFVTGIGALGLLGWRRKRKNVAA
ncbi:MAG TPA: VPLPA-CTERM sorting domain-containing protein [Pseudolabrys sp.]|nr:VPLPA-CTERM sorting domain-containing protein [Pseudolabrys sp.]